MKKKKRTRPFVSSKEVSSKEVSSKEVSSKEKPRKIVLERAISKKGCASRTIARAWISAGRIRVNTQIIRTSTFKVLESDTLFLDNEELKPRPFVYYAFNKPRGLVTTTRDEHGRSTVYDAFPLLKEEWLFPVGRLDKDSEGLLFFTNNTMWSEKILSPETHLLKTYHVQINRHLNEAELSQIRQGMLLGQGEQTRPVEVTPLRFGRSNSWVEMKLSEGLNRQIRRMIGAFSARALRVVRVAIGPVQLGTLKKGEIRPLSEEELIAIRELQESKEKSKEKSKSC
jgi:23S rRNA pseudouridine2605 synthase